MRIAAVSACVAMLSISVAALGQSVVSTTPLGTVPTSTESKYIVSPDGGRVALVKPAGSRMLVSVDGVDGEVFDEITYIVRGNAYSGPDQAQLVIFSKDGKHHAYGARRGGENFVVVDGKTYPGGQNFIFSPNGARFAYTTGAIGAREIGTAVVIDGVVGPAIDVASDLQFSSDSKRVLHVSFKQGERRVVVDGKASQPITGDIWFAKFSANGKSYGFMAPGANNKVAVYIDGVAQNATLTDSSIGQEKLQFSESGNSWSAVAVSSGGGNQYAWRAVVNGVPGPAYDRVDNLVLSPDGKRFAYVATKGMRSEQRAFLIVDGKQLGYEYMRIEKPRFSPDSKHVMIDAMTQAGSFVVVDGKESDALLSPGGDFAFSNNGRYFYTARMKGSQESKVVVDGKIDNDIREYLKGTMSFSPDGSRLVYSATKSYSETFSSIDGKVEPFGIQNSWGTRTGVAAVWSPDSKHVAFMAHGPDHPQNVFVDLKPGVTGWQYAMAVFSPDGRHVAMAARDYRNSKAWSLLLDGKAVASFDEILEQLPATWAFQPDGKLRVVAMKDKQFQRVVVDPQTSSLESFSANLSKGGKAPDSKVADKGSKKKGSDPTTMTASSSGDTEVQKAKNKVNEVPDPEAEADSKVDEAGDKVKKKVDKGLKKIKGLFGDK